MKWGIILTLITSWYLVGLSVTVGLVVYPSFALVGEPEWPAFHHHHIARITGAVGAPWLLQALGLLIWCVGDPHWLSWPWLVSAAGALGSVIVTVVWAVRLHDRMRASFDPRVARVLRRAHWWRSTWWLVAAVSATMGLSFR